MTTNHFMMDGMKLGPWILTHLRANDIHGLHIVEERTNEITFRFPWSKMGDPHWEQNWQIIFVSICEIKHKS